MKAIRGRLLMSALLCAALPLLGCGNAYEGGSSPSGSYITAAVEQETFEPDIFLTLCDDGEYEPGLFNTYATVLLYNNSAPNTPEGETTNHDVTMSRYRVDYTGLNKTVSIASFDGAASTVRVPADGSEAQMIVNVLPLDTMEYIRSHYPTIGLGESLELRATVTIWGKDVYDVTVSTEVEITLVVDDYNGCG